MLTVERERQFRLLWSQGDCVVEIGRKMRMDHVRALAKSLELGLDINTATSERRRRAILWRRRLREARLHEELVKGCAYD